MTASPRLSIVISTRNRGELIGQTIEFYLETASVR